jgi:hypothetical protein
MLPAQQYCLINGSVFDESSMLPVGQVRIYIIQDSAVVQNTKSDLKGYIEHTSVTRGSYDILLQKEGYQSVRFQNVPLYASRKKLNLFFVEESYQNDTLVLSGKELE